MTDQSQEQIIVDAVIANLEADLPEHTTFPYFRPPVIMPEDCPALCVWVDLERSAPRTTHWLSYDYYIGIGWYEEVVGQAETLVQDIEKALALLDALKIIKDHVQSMCIQGLDTVHGLYEVAPSDVRYIEVPRGLNLATGLTQGYSVGVRVSTLEG